MHRARAMLRSGDWLTRQRVRFVAVALLLASAAGFLFLVVTSHGGVDIRAGRSAPISPMSMPPAVTCSAAIPMRPFDPVQQFAREQAIFGASTQFYGWHYPPYFLFVAAALA